MHKFIGIAEILPQRHKLFNIQLCNPKCPCTLIPKSHEIYAGTAKFSDSRYCKNNTFLNNKSRIICIIQ